MPLTHEAIRSHKAPVPAPIFSQAIKCGDMVFVSGNVGISPVTQQIIEGSCYDRAIQTLTNIKNVLEEAGSGLDKIVKVTSPGCFVVPHHC